MLIFGVQVPTWNFDMIRKSRRMFTINLTELITSGTSGLSSARVAFETATSTAELRAEKALMRIYVILASRTSCGIKADENCRAAPTKMRLIHNPRIAWKMIKVYASPSRALGDRASLSAIVTHTARGRPSFITSAIVPMYVYTSVVTTNEELIFAIQIFTSVPYSAGRIKAAVLKSSAPA
jgi:hypothetical protein